MNCELIAYKNQEAGEIMKCMISIKTAVLSFEPPASIPEYPASDSSINVLFQTQYGMQAINYRYKTNKKDSPTKRLIEMKRLAEKTGSREPKGSPSVTLYSNSPQLLYDF